MRSFLFLVTVFSFTFSISFETRVDAATSAAVRASRGSASGTAVHLNKSSVPVTRTASGEVAAASAALKADKTAGKGVRSPRGSASPDAVSDDVFKGFDYIDPSEGAAAIGKSSGSKTSSHSTGAVRATGLSEAALKRARSKVKRGLLNKYSGVSPSSYLDHVRRRAKIETHEVVTPAEFKASLKAANLRFSPDGHIIRNADGYHAIQEGRTIILENSRRRLAEVYIDGQLVFKGKTNKLGSLHGDGFLYDDFGAHVPASFNNGRFKKLNPGQEVQRREGGFWYKLDHEH